MNILVSACLMGVNCRYNAVPKEMHDIEKLLKHHHLIPVCPEIMGGLPTPRPAVEIKNGRALNTLGEDVTAEFERGAQEVLRLAKLYHCDLAILKERSPSCGRDHIYDGTFTGTIIDGNGITAQLLMDHGIKVISESDISQFIEENC